MPYYRDESNGEDSKSKKSVTLPDEFAEFLTVEADRQGITPDDLLDDIIREEVLFRHPLSKVGYVEIPNPEFQSYLDRLTINDIKEVAREQASRNFDSVLSLLRGKPGDFNSIIEQFYKIFSKYSGWFTFAYKVTGKNGLVLSFRHTKGIKWSIFLAEYNRVVLEKFCSKTSMQTLDNEVIFDVVLNQD